GGRAGAFGIVRERQTAQKHPASCELAYCGAAGAHADAGRAVPGFSEVFDASDLGQYPFTTADKHPRIRIVLCRDVGVLLPRAAGAGSAIVADWDRCITSVLSGCVI